MLPEVSREERRLIRQRGAGARQLTDTSFAFTFGAGSPGKITRDASNVDSAKLSPPAMQKDKVPVTRGPQKIVPRSEHITNPVKDVEPKKRGRPKVQAPPPIAETPLDSDGDEISVAAPLVKNRKARTRIRSHRKVSANFPDLGAPTASHLSQPITRRRPPKKGPHDQVFEDHEEVEVHPETKHGTAEHSLKQPAKEKAGRMASYLLDLEDSDEAKVPFHSGRETVVSPSLSGRAHSPEMASQRVTESAQNSSNPVGRRRGRPPKAASPEADCARSGEPRGKAQTKSIRLFQKTRKSSSRVEENNHADISSSKSEQLCEKGSEVVPATQKSKLVEPRSENCRLRANGAITASALPPRAINSLGTSDVSQEPGAGKDGARGTAPGLLVKTKKSAFIPQLGKRKRAVKHGTEQAEDPGDLGAILRRYGDPKIPAKLMKTADSRFKFRF